MKTLLKVSGAVGTAWLVEELHVRFSIKEMAHPEQPNPRF